MDQHGRDAAQQGLLSGLFGAEHEANLQRFINGLRREPEWTDEQLVEVEQKIRILIGIVRQEQRATDKSRRLHAPWRVVRAE